MSAQTGNNIKRETGEYVYHQEKVTEGGIILLLIMIGLPIGLVALTADEPMIIRILSWVIALGAGLNAVRIGLTILFSTPLTLSISNRGILASNWQHTLLWSEIGQAKIVKKEAEKVVEGSTTTFKPKQVSLVLYSKDEPDKALSTVAGFDKFEKTNEIVQMISERLGRPVLSVRVEDGIEVEVKEVEARVEREPKLSRADLEARIAASLCPKCEAQVSPEDQICPSCRINLVYARQNLDQLLR